MRDIILLSALLAVVPLILRSPMVGILGWIWIALMNPQREVYGFLSTVPLNFLIAILTAVAWAISRERKSIPLNALTGAVIAFAIWTSITTYFALQFDHSYMLWDRTIKTLVLVLAIIAICTSKARIQATVWVIVISLGFYSIKGGGFVLLTGGSHRVYGPANSMIEDNNSLGLALVMVLPFMNYLRITTKAFWIRIGLVGAMIFTSFAIIGTYSRGALVALAVSLGAYAMKSRSGLVPLVLIGAVLIALPTLVPGGWFERMSTIKSASQDASFQERLQAWQTSWNITMDRPVVGGGFSAIENNWVAQKYRSPGSLDIGRASHSIYMEVLSDHGFVGLGLYFLILIVAWLNTSSIIRQTRDRPELSWANLLGRMMQVSMLGYLVGGAGLSMAYYDGFLIILSLSAALLATLYRYQDQTDTKPVPRWRQTAEPAFPEAIALPKTAARRPA